MSRGKAPPFKQRLETVLAAARAAGFGRLKITTNDGASYEFEVQSSGETLEINDFDRPPNATPAKRANAGT
jgi:hypothetical protein